MLGLGAAVFVLFVLTSAPASAAEPSPPTATGKGAHQQASSSEPGAAHNLVLQRLETGTDPIELTHRVAVALEEAILAAPEEWLWMSPPIRRLPSEKSAR